MFSPENKRDVYSTLTLLFTFNRVLYFELYLGDDLPRLLLFAGLHLSLDDKRLVQRLVEGRVEITFLELPGRG